VQKDLRWTDHNTKLLDEANRTVLDFWEDLRRLRANHEVSKVMIRESQRLIAEVRGSPVDHEVAQVATAPSPRQSARRSNGTIWPAKLPASSKQLVVEAYELHRRATEAFQCCVCATESFQEMREKAWTLIDEAKAVLRCCGQLADH
jgi:hypothetical protein